MTKTSGNCFYIVNGYFPCHFVNSFGLTVLSYRPSSFDHTSNHVAELPSLEGIL